MDPGAGHDPRPAPSFGDDMAQEPQWQHDGRTKAGREERAAWRMRRAVGAEPMEAKPMSEQHVRFLRDRVHAYNIDDGASRAHMTGEVAKVPADVAQALMDVQMAEAIDAPAVEGDDNG